MNSSCSLCFFVFCLLLEITISARYYVSSTGNGTTGISWNTAFKYLDDAINAIQSNSGSNEIWIKQGTYYPQTKSRLSCFNIPANTKIYGGFSGSETSISQRIITTSLAAMTILDGDIQNIGNSSDNCYHVINITKGLLDTLVIRNGYADEDGDGGETNQFGGGIYIGSDTNVNVTLNRVQIINNTAHLGGGIFALQENNYIAIYQSIFEGNTATAGSYLGGYGGAIHVSMGIDIVIEKTEFINNKAVYRGGAIYQDYGAKITCQNCLFTNNSAISGHGGSWFAENRNSQLGVTTCDITNSTFSLNYAFGYGGACTFLKDVIISIQDSVFNNNFAQNSGGAITYYDITNLTTINNKFDNNIANTDLSTNDIYNGSFPDFTTVNKTISYNISEYLKVLWNDRAITKQYNDDLPSVNGANLCYVKLCDNCLESLLNGTSWNSAYTNVQQCIDKLANLTNINEKEIWVSQGTYYPTRGLPFSVQPEYPYFYSFLMSPNIRMYGGFNGNETKRSQRNWYLNPTILSCARPGISCTIVMNAADNVIVDGFIFTGGLYNISQETGNLNNVVSTTQQPQTTLQSTSSASTTSSTSTTSSASTTSSTSTTSSSTPLSTKTFSTSQSSSQRKLLSATYTTQAQILQSNTGGRGGGIFSNGTNITIVNSIFLENLGAKGGGLYCIGLSSDGITHKSPTMTNVAFINNVAERGGAIMGDLNCEFQCNSCIFESNTASGKGGAIYLDYFCDISINNSKFRNNIAYESGGCLANDGLSYALLNNNLFYNNIAKWEAGCLYGGTHISGGSTSFYVIDSTFQNNSVYYGFDNIWLWPTDYLILEDNVTTNVPSTTNLPATSTQASLSTTSIILPTITTINTTRIHTSTISTVTTNQPEESSGSILILNKFNIIFFVFTISFVVLI